MIKFGLKRLADNYMQIWNADSEGLLDIYAEPSLLVEYTHLQPIEGIAQYKSFLQTTYRTFSNLKVNIGEIITNKKEDSITVFWSFSGIHRENVLFGVQPSGKEVSVNAMTVLTVKKGKVVREKGIMDNLSLLMQLHPQ